MSRPSFRPSEYAPGLRTALARLRSAITLLGWAIGITLLVTILIVVLAQVISRRGLGSPLPWPEEAARLALVLLTFLGAGILSMEDLHIQVDALTSRLVGTTARIIEVVRTLVVVAVPLTLVWGARDFIALTFSTRTASLRITRGWIMSLVAVGFIWLAIGAIMGLRQRLHEAGSGPDITKQHYM